MGAVRSIVVLTAGAVIGVAGLIAYRISQDQGKSLQEALSDVPGEMERLYAELKAKGVEALEKGRAAYVSKQQEFAEQFNESGTVQP
jgi:hypothetical protein